MNFANIESKMASLEDFEFLPPLQDWDFPVDELYVTKCSSENCFADSGDFVEDVLEEMDSGCGLDIGCEWLTDRVNLSALELELSEFSGFDLANDVYTPETQVDVTKDTSLSQDTEKTSSGGPFLEELLTQTCPVSPEQCVPESVVFSPISSPSHSYNTNVCSLNGEEIFPLANKTPKQSRISSCDTKIGAIISDSAKIAKTLHIKEKDSLTTKHHKVQPKIKTVSQRKRKQVQNRDAATRYRIKKKEECDVLFNKAEELERENEELSKTVGSLTQEIEYLRKLMVEVYKNRLLKSLPIV